jgi:hypothetical protein
MYTTDKFSELIVDTADIEIRTSLGATTFPEQLRARREACRKLGRPVDKLPADAFRDQVVVIFGPQVSRQAALRRLRRIMNNIKQDGLITGVNYEDSFVRER